MAVNKIEEDAVPRSIKISLLAVLLDFLAGALIFAITGKLQAQVQVAPVNALAMPVREADAVCAKCQSPDL